jgi:hypothetical protein
MHQLVANYSAGITTVIMLAVLTRLAALVLLSGTIAPHTPSFATSAVVVGHAHAPYSGHVVLIVGHLGLQIAR